MTSGSRVTSVLLVMALAVAACSPGSVDLSRADVPNPTGAVATTDTTSPPSTIAPAPTTTAPPPPPVPAIAWSSCGGRAECAVVSAPLDYADPTGPTIEIAVSRVPATGDRIGALFLNFGGPGGDAHDRVKTYTVPAEISERFDIVGMDPRGVGRSTALSCGIDATTLYAVDPTIEDQADADALLEISERYVLDCAADPRGLLPHVGTRSVARDMDLIRAAMGDDTLNFLGMSYGSSIGQVYADLFPDRVRAMIIDGIVDTGIGGIDLAIEQALGFETALANWAAQCSSRSTCSFDEPIAAVEAMQAAAEDVLPGGSRPFGPGEASTGLALPLYAQSLWDDLDQAIVAALGGDGSGMVRLADRYLGLVDFSIYFAVSCLDNEWPTDTAAFLAEGKRAATLAPRFGEAIVNDYVRCALWPTPSQPLGPITAPGAPPILVVSTTGDPATPYENGVTVADRLASGVLLTYEGEGHIITFRGSSCVDAIAVDYLVRLAVPADGTRC